MYSELEIIRITSSAKSEPETSMKIQKLPSTFRDTGIYFQSFL